jgi:uncharacterized membrane protein
MKHDSLRVANEEVKKRLGKPRTVALSFVFIWFFVGGIMHFVATDMEARIVPPYIGHPVFMVLLSGVFELLGAIGILFHATRRATGIGLFLLTLAVTPANIYMLQHPELFHVPLWALWLRLPLQAVLLWIILWSTWHRNTWEHTQTRSSQMPGVVD